MDLRCLHMMLRDLHAAIVPGFLGSCGCRVQVMPHHATSNAASPATIDAAAARCRQRPMACKCISGSFVELGCQCYLP